MGIVPVIAADQLPLYLGIPLAILCIATSIFAIGMLVLLWREFRGF